MVFSSFIFLFYFLPLSILIYFILPNKLKNIFLVSISLFFFSFGEPKFTPILLSLCAVDFILGIFIDQFKNKGENYKAKLSLIASISINIIVFIYFKYSNFFVKEFSSLLLSFGYPEITWHKVVLPLGISFFTFHKISYIVDIYRGTSSALRNPFLYALYILFFPQLIAGPIIRYHEIADQLSSRKFSLDNLFEGMYRFSIGLAKKVLVADVVGHTADQVFKLSSDSLSMELSWLGILSYTAQIYFDFSGYSDMAIGLARVFGFKFPENFNDPYIARNFTDFWRRWHISLGKWMREYIYIPLGGNKLGQARQFFNLWLVFLFSGMWHGAEWTFILWGVYHGIFLTLDKLFLVKITEKFPVIIQVLITLFFVTLSRVLFRSDSLEHSFYYYQALFIPTKNIHHQIIGAVTTHFEIFMIIFSYLLALWKVLPGVNKIIYKFISSDFFNRNLFLIKSLTMVAFLFLSSIILASTDFSPFIYFQF